MSRDAALSEWRQRALEWDLAHGATDAASRFSLLELLWLGAGTAELPADWDAWGAAALPLTGCLCLAMPRPRPWEENAGYASALLGTRAADVALRVAEMLAETKLPASLAPALVRYTMQDVLDHARLSRPGDWNEFGRAARGLPRERLADEISALAAGGPLVAALTADQKMKARRAICKAAIRRSARCCCCRRAGVRAARSSASGSCRRPTALTSPARRGCSP